ncbi:MAG: hypothetical protein KDD42_08155 [Bdellovibrionales bacterium]|nr:hypothetical protein [Bdellovibrionales bacterium]
MTLALGVDQGSSSTKAVLIDSSGQSLWQDSLPVSTLITAPDRVEQNPEELFDSVKTLIDRSFDFVQSSNRTISTIGLAFQRSGVCAWDRDGAVLHSLLTWRDRRTLPLLEALGEDRRVITEITSLPAIPDYAGGKIALLQSEFSDQRYFIGTLDSFVLYRLSNGQVWATDDSMAARTMLYGFKEHGWDAELCRLSKVDRSRLAPIRSSIGSFGRYRDVPITAMLGDQQASLIGRMQSQTEILINMGSISSVCVPTGSTLLRLQGYPASILFSEEISGVRHFQYLIEGITNASGSVIESLRKKLGIDPESLSDLDRLCRVQRNSDPTVFCAINGTASPHWRYDLPVRSVHWDGIDFDLLVAPLIENIGNFIVTNLLALLNNAYVSGRPSTVFVSGGLSQSDYLLQYLADCAEVSIARLPSHDCTALGAALCAFRGIGISEKCVGAGAASIFSPRDRWRKQERYQFWFELMEGLMRHEPLGRALDLL